MPNLAALGSQGAYNAGFPLQGPVHTWLLWAPCSQTSLVGVCWERKSPVCRVLAERTLPMPQAARPHEPPPSRWTLGSGWRQWSPSGTLSATHFPATVQPDSVVNCTKPLHPGLQNIFIIQNFKCHYVWMESLSFLTQTLY